MSDISFFNQLFVEAARRGLRLNSFHQLDSGLFRANWRVDERPSVLSSGSPKPWFGPAAEHAQPFLAAHNAYVMADLQAPAIERPLNYAKEFELSLAHQDGADNGGDADLFG